MNAADLAGGTLQWHALHPHPAAAVLPKEPLTEIFRYLNFSGRLAASHVCVAWRRIALSDRRLWAQYRICLKSAPPKGTAPKVRALVCLLGRSAPLPFRLDCESYVPDAIVRLVISHIQRMKELNLGRFETESSLRHLLSQNIPTLTRISLSHAPSLCAGQHLSISASWASAIHLRILSIKLPCLWPVGCSFVALRAFSGFVPEVSGLHVALSNLFPNLKYLSLYKLTEASVNFLNALPSSLTVLKLHADSGIDCTSLFRGRTSLALRELKIDCTHSASCVLEVFRLFERSVDGPWALRVYGGIIDLRAPPHGDTYWYDVFNIATSWLLRSAEILAHCDGLHTLHIGLVEFLHFCAANAVLPSLAEAKIVIHGLHEFGTALALRGTRGVHTPALRSVIVSLNARLDLDAHVAAMLASVVHAFHSSRLASVVIHGVLPETFHCEGLHALAYLGERVEAQDCAGNVVHVFSS